jgi:hypothetical protein
VAKAGRADESFRERTFGGRLLRCLVRRAYEEAKRDRDFAAVIGIPVQEVLLNRPDQLVAGQAAMQQQIAELKAMFAPQIATTTTEYRPSREVVDRLLTNAGLAEIEPAAIPDAFGELARRFAAMRDALQRQGNGDPEIATLKQQASDALLSADLDADERLLATIRARQRTLSEWRRRNADEAHADFMAAIKDEAGTCARQADAALLRLDVAAALDFYRDGGAVLGDAPPETRWDYMFLAQLRWRASANGRCAMTRSWRVLICMSLLCATQAAIGYPAIGRRLRQTSAGRLRRLGNARAVRRIWRRRSPPFAQHLRK